LKFIFGWIIFKRIRIIAPQRQTNPFERWTWAPSGNLLSYSTPEGLRSGFLQEINFRCPSYDKKPPQEFDPPWRLRIGFFSKFKSISCSIRIAIGAKRPFAVYFWMLPTITLGVLGHLKAK
jgi:hypothetical protein